MKRLILAFCYCLAVAGTAFSSNAVAAPIRALIVYDQQDGAYQKLGKAYAIMLRNLLGHFDTQIEVDMYDVKLYGTTAASQLYGKTVNDYQITFYLGSSYDNPAIPALFLSDATSSSKSVVWFKYNLWKAIAAYDAVAAAANTSFVGDFGFSWLKLGVFDAAPSLADPKPGFFNTVIYKGQTLEKYYAYNSQTGVVAADPDAGIVSVVNPSLVDTFGDLRNFKTAEQAPYIVKAKNRNFWYVADLPFSFIGPRDRYLAFADVLHDMVGQNHAEQRRALVRLEDVAVHVDPDAMKTLSDYFYAQNPKVPFSIALIPHYADPLGKYNGGAREDVPFQRATTLYPILDYAMARGGKILMHGWTHQYSNVPNIYTAVSGDDFEFWNAANNTPIAGETANWALNRLQNGLKELLAVKNGKYRPFAFEFPHYQASPVSSKVVPQVFAKTYQRAVYYTSDNPQLTAATNKDYAVGQFYPYIIQKDYYGQRVLPENLGNIEYNLGNYDPTSNITYTAQDLMLNAEKATVVRDGFASFFFHPFWLEPEILPHIREVANPNPFNDLKLTVDKIKSLGYTFVDPAGL